MKTKTIIRVEGEDGYGMFRDCIGRKYVPATELPAICMRHQLFNTPYQDGLNIADNWFCAYKTIEQLQDWVFTGELKEIIDNGFKVLLLDVTEYQEGTHQVIYTKESIVGMKDISNLFV